MYSINIEQRNSTAAWSNTFYHNIQHNIVGSPSGVHFWRQMKVLPTRASASLSLNIFAFSSGIATSILEDSR